MNTTQIAPSPNHPTVDLPAMLEGPRLPTTYSAGLELPTVTAHIINNAEIQTTECGRQLAGIPAGDDMTPAAMSYGDEVALWDDAPTAGYLTCSACHAAYNA